jgi:WhiB family redox-sensing transcriptional regulator
MQRLDQSAPPTLAPQASAPPNNRVRPGSRKPRSGPRRRGPELAALDWQQRGACRIGDDGAFFAPDTPGEPRAARLSRLIRAKRVCAGCAVRELCRSYALENEEEFGVWGGLSEVERRQLIAERCSVSGP